MNTVQLEIFLTMAETLNYTTAARKLYMTQPTVSRNISSLEVEIGAKLFLRENNAVSLTPAGELLARELAPMQLQYADLLQRVKNRGAGLAGEIRLGVASEQQLPWNLLEAIRNFSAAHGDVEFQFFRMSADELSSALLDGRIDAAVQLGIREAELPSRQAVLLAEEPACLAAARSADAPARRAITAEECREILGKTRLVFPRTPQAGALHDGIDPVRRLQQMLGLDALTADVQYIADASAIAFHVAAGLGVTVVNSGHTLARDPGIMLLELEGAEKFQKILLWYAEQKNPVFSRFLECPELRSPGGTVFSARPGVPSGGLSG